MAEKSDPGTYRLQTKDGTSPQTIVVQVPEQKRSRGWGRFLIITLALLLITSFMFNIGMYASFSEYVSDSQPEEKFYSGTLASSDKIAVLRMSGTISPPFTGRMLSTIEKVAADDDVKGILLVVDSPGGLVADSHQIYHALRETEKPIFVQMKRLAASGGYYVSMAAGPEGKIFAEPTTWTGSIGVIIPRYNMEELANKVGVESDPLVTGPYKDALSPFREMTEGEREVWKGILDDAFERFVGVISTNRSELTEEDVKALATGQIYTANQALQNGMVDEIGFEEDAIAALKEELGLEQARLVTYKHPQTLAELLIGLSARDPQARWNRFLEATVPQPHYLFSWGLGLPGMSPIE